MDRGDYFEAKAALLNLRCVQLENEIRLMKANQLMVSTLTKCEVPSAPAHTWNDADLTITPVEASHGR